MENFDIILANTSFLTSTILAFFAIWLSIVFYNRSKDSEKNINQLLTEIRTHTATLEKLTGRWMDRLTRYVTSPQPADETTIKLLELISISYTGLGQRLQTPSEDETQKQLISQLVSTYIAIFYYCGLTNLSTQGHLPINETEADAAVRGIVDSSHVDYFSVKQTLSSITDGELRANTLYRLYEQAISWEGSIKNSTIIYTERSAFST